MTDRRSFLKNSAKASALAAPAFIKAQTVTRALKIGLVGCGGRGTGAASQALKADDYAELSAVADIDLERIDSSLNTLKKRQADKIKVDPAKRFTGLDSYKQVIESDVDVVLLATPPGFRPLHYRAAVEAGKHLFVEKPIAVDAFGVRDVLAMTKVAEEKKLSVVSGFCWRYSAHIVETFKQIHSGAIGDLRAYYGTYFTGPVKPMPPAASRPAGMSDVEWEIRNWYNFNWTCGDGLVEQAVHTVDKVAWAFQDKAPVSCTAVGGRQIPQEGGNIFDHFEVNYLYPGNARAFVVHRQIPGCHNENMDHIMGSKGICTIGRAAPYIEGETSWRYDGPRNDMYQYEHDVLFASLRRGAPVNNGERMATSTMLAIMGRMAAYTGQQITWDQALNSQERVFPEKLEWGGKLNTPGTPLPGITKFL
jgi:myo-inositol 2-dehydrogenase / D-chiro-inositol 1-dehydrogenase